jgi:hypothetical protein
MQQQIESGDSEQGNDEPQRAMYGVFAGDGQDSTEQREQGEEIEKYRV